MKTVLLTLLCCGGWACAALAQDAPPVRRAPMSMVPRADESGYTGLPIMEALSLYGKLTGTQVIADNTVQGVLVLPKLDDVGDEKKIQLIEEAIFLNGFSLYDAGDHVVGALGLAKPPRYVGVPIYSKPEELPSGERVFTYIVKLSHRNPTHLAGILQQYIPPMTTTAFTPDEESHTLLVTGTTSVVRKVIQLVPFLDIVADGLPDATREKPAAPPPRPVAPRADGAN